MLGGSVAKNNIAKLPKSDNAPLIAPKPSAQPDGSPKAVTLRRQELRLMKKIYDTEDRMMEPVCNPERDSLVLEACRLMIGDALAGDRDMALAIDVAERVNKRLDHRWIEAQKNATERMKIKAQVATTAVRSWQPNGYQAPPPDLLEAIRAAKDRGIWRPIQAVLNNTRREFASIIRKAGKKCPSLVRKVDERLKATASIHDFRRSAITNWAKRLPLNVVKDFAGHSTIVTTDAYYATTTEDQFEVARQAAEEAVAAGTKPNDYHRTCDE